MITLLVALLALAVGAILGHRTARVRVIVIGATAAQDEAAVGWADLDSTCCLRAWESRGADHDTAHCTRKDQTA